MSLHLLGIRHHGPGSSRNILESLAAIEPDIILIEGPPEGESMLQWVAHEQMKPPVALLAYVPDNPRRAVFYPFTTFSPEWNAIKYALANKIPVRFIDMPLVHSLATGGAEEPMPETETAETEDEPIDPDPAKAEQTFEQLKRNPMSYLAALAGFEDAEEWWEQSFELAHKPGQVFEAVEAAVTALREELPLKEDREEEIREAFMRKAIRTAEREMYTRIAVVCGAWHVPALHRKAKQKDDDALLKNLPKVKVDTTWIPWTNDRLSYESGYGAGVQSPGWYAHSWQHADDNGALWLAHTARIFRANKVDISSAHIIEAVRLANALAGLRSLARPGLKEFSEATLAVMCMGDEILMRLINKELIVGRELGEIPEGTPQAPVQRDLEQQVKKLRMKISNEEKLMKLDLREESDLQKSILLHRLQAIDVAWGNPRVTSGKGTFKEEWAICWFPELTIDLLEKAPWGNTVEAAATRYLADRAAKCTRLDEITLLVQKALPADLQNAVRNIMRRMDELAAGTSDTLVLMDAFAPLVQVSRYGNVRKTDLATVGLIMTAIFYRITAGLPPGCTNIDDDQAATMAEKIKQVTQSVLLLEDPALKGAWLETMKKITGLQQTAPMVHGCCCKILYDAGVLGNSEMEAEFSKALSVNNSPGASANWLEGFLKDAATVLILDDDIWGIVNGWLLALDEAVFMQVVPLLRRTFAVYTNTEKRKIAPRAARGGGEQKATQAQYDIDT
ncbi:MAG: hypothetical protein H7257_11260, partial [Taibaiella sp.]|nr:hypothetical protein [Taibaiella sp.]